MKKIVSIISVSLTLAVSSANAGKNVAPAESPVAPVIVPTGIYVGAGVLASLLTRDCACQTGKISDNTYGGVIKAGYNFNRFLGIEARAYTAPIEKDFLKIDNYVGIFVKPQVSVGEKGTLYGLLGYGRTKISANCPGIGPHTHSIKAPAFGAGFEYNFDSTNVDGKRKGWSVWTDIINVMSDKTEKKFNDNIVAVGVGYHF